MMKAFPVPPRVKEGVLTPISDMDRYREVWADAANDPDDFWLRETRRSIRWQTPPTRGLEGDFRSIRQKPIQWFSDGVLNITESCIDRHAEATPDKAAIIWEGDEPHETRTVSYQELLEEVSRVANTLKALGVKKGDRVLIYMGMIPQTAFTMLACARIGAVHSVVFGGFSSDAVRDRIKDSGAQVVVTQDASPRGGRHTPLKATVDKALQEVDSVRHVLVYARTGADIPLQAGRDLRWEDTVAKADTFCPAEPMNAEDPLFVLYTSGSTGRPKGLLHTSGGYITWAAYTQRTVFDLRPDDVFGCMADVGWITGHTYIVYAPLANGITTVMFESTPLYPDASRYWDLIEKHKLTIFYTAPTALRTVAAQDPSTWEKHDLSSIRILGTVGEPINPDAWNWYYKHIGKEQCTIVDTWWQTETGGICLSPIAPATPTKPGCATLPMPGVYPVVLEANGTMLHGPTEGALALAMPWPGMARTIWGDHARYVSTYFEMYPGFYFAGDGCRRDSDGYFWITGRVDDVINVSGHRMGTAEFEAALLEVDKLSESAVVGYPHPVKGQGVYAYVVPRDGVAAGDALVDEIQATLRRVIGAHARVDRVQFVDALPKTRSGKIMRRILRKIAEGEHAAIGDTSTLAEADVVDRIIDGNLKGED